MITHTIVHHQQAAYFGQILFDFYLGLCLKLQKTFNGKILIKFFPFSFFSKDANQNNVGSNHQINSQFIGIRTSDNIKHQLLPNGSLLINLVQKTDAGLYFCAANNGIGPGLSKVIYSKMIHLNVHCKWNRIK